MIKLNNEKRAIIDEYVVRHILEITIEITLRVLIKIIEEKYFKFMKIYGNKLGVMSKQEELECRKYFKEAYIREAKKRHFIA